MKTYKNLYDTMIDPFVVWKCMLEAAQGKLKRRDVMKAIRNFNNTYTMVTTCLLDPKYKPYEENTHQIIDGVNHKQRKIEKPRFCPEQIIHHILIEPFKPVLLDGLYEQVYGCLPKYYHKNKDGTVTLKKFGPHAAIKQLVKWVQIESKVYVAELDIHHAYESVIILVLLDMLKKSIKDKRWLYSAEKFLEGKDGLVLGHYTSPWFFNFYLKEFDHVVAAIPGIKYLRFADNMFLVGKNKRELHRAVSKLESYLSEHLGMSLNNSKQVYRFEYTDKHGNLHGRAVNALGAVIHHDRVTLRKSILKRMRKKSLKLKKKQGDLTWHDGASMLSRLAWVRHTDIHTYFTTYIKPNINIRELKNKVRIHSKKLTAISEQRRELIHDSMEKSTWLTARTTK